MQGVLAELKVKLFNPEVTVEASKEETESERYAQGIQIFECGDPTTEVRSIAKEIKRLVVREGYSLTDIAIVLRDRTDYEELIARVFSEQGVPCNLHRSQAATAFPSVKAAVKLLQLIDEMGGSDASEIKMSSLASIIKTGYFDPWNVSEISAQYSVAAPVIVPSVDQLSLFESPTAPSLVDRPSIDELENAIAFVGENLNGAAWLNRAAKLIAGLAAVKRRQNGDSNLSDEDVDREESTENGVAGGRVRSLAGITAEMLQASAVAVEQILGIINSTVRLGGLPEVKRSLETLFDRLGYAADVRSRIRQSDTELDRALNDLSGFESLQLAIDATIKSFEIAGEVSQKEETAVSISEFSRSVSSCLNRLYGASHSSARRGVELLSATDVRGLRFRVIFIAGLVEGAFPKRVQQDWIYSHEERERLKRYGLKLEDISPNTLLKEEHYFYQAACRATERLYLTRPVVLSDGTETVESYYINEIRHALSPREIRTEKVRPGAIDPAKLGDCSTPTELVLAVTALTEENNSNGDMMHAASENAFAKLNDWLLLQEVRTESEQRRVAAARERSGLGFGRFDGRITNELLKQAIRAKFNGHYLFSASQLGLYGACPFKFFSEKILRLEPRGEAAVDLAAMETGRILHEILRRFFEKHRGELLDPSKYESLCGELREIADSVFDEHEKHAPPLDPQVWRLNREIRKIELERFLFDELEMQSATASSGIRPKFFELSFGAKVGRVDPGSVGANLELRREGSTERILVQGRIDRVDQSHDGTTVAYDYKLSSGADRADMEAGRDLQLAIYLEALEQLFFPGRQVAGGGYYTLKSGSGRRNRGLYRRELATYTDISSRTASNLSDEEWLNLRRVMMDRVWSFWEEMREGLFDIAPTAPTRTCQHCDFSALCRYEQHRVREKLRAASRRLQAEEVHG
jgi:ATP-dependent helicase/DNAse subunit B